MERSPAPAAPPYGDAVPGVARSAARLRLASLQGPAQTPPSAPGLPLSEAIAAQYFARRPWWRKLGAALGDRVPATLRGSWALEFRAVVALACLALVGAAVGGWYLYGSRTTVVELPAASGAVAGGAPSAAPVVSQDVAAVMAMPTVPSPTSASGTIVVDVEGKVAHPGIETLPSGSRVYEAIRAAGGALPGADATGVDLARPLVDGEQLRVGLPGAPAPPVGLEAGPAASGAHGKKGKSGQPVNLNTATVEQLQGIPGVGPAMAQRILDWRTQHGKFTTVAQLRQVRGIGERKFADMKDSVTV